MDDLALLFGWGNVCTQCRSAARRQGAASVLCVAILGIPEWVRIVGFIALLVIGVSLLWLAYLIHEAECDPSEPEEPRP